MIAFRTPTLLLLALLVAACDDSTGPGAADLRFAARSFDALEQSRMGAADFDGAVASRAAALALRTGTRPARVHIAVDGVRESYWALEVEHAFTPDLTGGPVLTVPFVSRTMVAWRGAPAERVISITIPSDTGTFSWERYQTVELPPPDRIYYEPSFGIMFERAGTVHFSVDGGARSTRQTIGAECTLPMRPRITQFVSPIIVPTCHAALFFTRFNMRVQEGPPAGAAAVRVRVVAMDGHDIPGIRLQYPWIYRPCPVCD